MTSIYVRSEFPFRVSLHRQTGQDILFLKVFFWWGGRGGGKNTVEKALAWFQALR